MKLFARKRTSKEDGPLQLSGLELPTFSEIALLALEKVRDGDSSMVELGDLLAADPGLSVRILSTVNSAAFGSRHTVRNIHHAASLLGRNEIEGMLIAVAVRSALPDSPAPGFEPRRFWTVAAKRAATARALARVIDPSTASESFTASLLQDMAVPLLAQQKEADYGSVLGLWHEGDGDLAHIERMTYDWDHAVVAAWMAEQWKFPETLVGAIGAHHGTDEGRYEGLPAVNLVAPLREVNEGRGEAHLIERAELHYGIPPGDIEALLEQSADDAAEISDLLC